MRSTRSLGDRIALVTGASSGIGREASLALAEAGARLALVGRDSERLAHVARAIGETSIALQGDVTDERSVRNVVRRVLDEAGTIDVLVNCAGIAAEAARVDETTDEAWQSVLDCNLTGTFRMCRAVLPHFQQRGHGVIVNVASAAAIVGMVAMSAYSAAKAGVVALTRSIAVEYGNAGIRANCVCPGTIETPMTEAFLGVDANRARAVRRTLVGRVGTPRDVADAIVFLASDAATFANGSVLVLDGGYTSW